MNILFRFYGHMLIWLKRITVTKKKKIENETKSSKQQQLKKKKKTGWDWTFGGSYNPV